MGLLRTLLIVFGVLFLLQLFGKVAQARQKMTQHRPGREGERRKGGRRQTFSKMSREEMDKASYTDYVEVDE